MAKRPIAFLLLVIVLTTTALSLLALPATAQSQIGTTTVFTDDTGFTVDVPQGWIHIDTNNTHYDPEIPSRPINPFSDLTVLANLCPQYSALYDEFTASLQCSGDHSVVVFAYYSFALDSEFAPFIRTGTGPNNLTAQDAVTYWLGVLTGNLEPRRAIIQSQDLLLNGSSLTRDGSLTPIPARIVHYTYEPTYDPTLGSTSLLSHVILQEERGMAEDAAIEDQIQEEMAEDAAIEDQIQEDLLEDEMVNDDQIQDEIVEEEQIQDELTSGFTPDLEFDSEPIEREVYSVYFVANNETGYSIIYDRPYNPLLSIPEEVEQMMLSVRLQQCYPCSRE